MNDLTKKFSKGTIAIHWLSAILIIALFPLGIYMEGIEPMDKMGLIKLHAAMGILVFLLTIVRSFFFFKHERPEHLRTGSKFNDKLAVWIHNAFYFLLLGIGLSGLAAMGLGGYGDALSSNAPELILNPEEVPPLKAHGALAFLLMF